MDQHALSALSAWENFYVIIGSSAGALTGLQFVVIALAADRNAVSDPRTTRAFATPTIVHFCAVLLTAAILSAPWRSLSSAGYTIGACGLAGIMYVFRVLWHMRRQTAYAAVLTDWIWYLIFPLLAYGALMAAGIAFAGYLSQSLFLIGGASLFLLFTGIHNAWDGATYITHELPKGQPNS